MPTASDSQLLNFLIGGAAVLTIVYLALGVWDKGRKIFGHARTVNVQPVDVEFATRNELQVLREWTEGRFESMQIDQVRSMGELHEKMNEIAKDVAFIRGQMTQ